MEVRCIYCDSINVYFSKKRKVYVCEDCEREFLPEKKFVPQKVFLSYGHDENEELVRLIYQKLAERGHRPWIDRAEIKAGMDWRNAISEGIRESSDFLAFISNHSVRVPGVCLDEISIGVGNWNCRMQSIILEKGISVPNSISNIQWLDLSEWRVVRSSGTPEVWNKWLDEQMERIYAVIEDEHSRKIAGNISEIETHLLPVTNGLKMRLILQNEIVGRRWLIALLSEWFRQPASARALVLYGTPGIGKSVISAYLCNFSDKCAATYFCEWNNSNTLHSRTLLHSLIFQLACSVEDYQGRVVEKLRERNIRTMSDDEVIEVFFFEMLHGLVGGGRPHKLIVIDALDETLAEGKEFLDTLRKLIRCTPPWIRFFITSRPEQELQEALRPYDTIALDSYRREIQADLREFVERSVSDQKTADRIRRRSDGSFVYARELIGLYHHDHKRLDFSNIPSGVGGIYYSNFERLFGRDEEYRERYQPVFEVLLAAKEQISEQELADILGGSAEETADTLRKLSSYILRLQHGKQTFLQVFHKSFQEWLITEEAGKYQVRISRGNERFIRQILTAVREDLNINAYMMKHAFEHIGQKRWEELPEQEQTKLIRKLLEAAQRYGDLDMEVFYLTKWEETFGRDVFYYIHAMDYYKKVSGEQLLKTARKAEEMAACMSIDEERFELLCQVAFAYFYAGYAQTSYELITRERERYPKEFWEDQNHVAEYWHVVAVSAHDLDNNADVIRAAAIDMKMYRSQKKYYDQYITIVNLFDGYMAIGDLAAADRYAEKVKDYIDSRYYIHVDDIYRICHANLLQTEGRIMEALVYYEEGLQLAKEIQKWDYVYGSIWRELAIARFGDHTCLRALMKYRQMAEDLGYQYLVSLADCFYIIAAHLLREIQPEQILRNYQEIRSVGMPGHILQAAVCCRLDGVLEIAPEEILSNLQICEGVKGHPALIPEYLRREKKTLASEQVLILEKWCEKYVSPIEAYQKEFRERIYGNLERKPRLGGYQCFSCQAKCCYDGVYLLAEEEEQIRQLIERFPEYFEEIVRPYVVAGDWEGMRSLRKTEKVPFDGYDELFPAHFTKTRCCFAMESGECLLQRVATDHQLHPWKAKPRACWSFPIRGVAGDEILPPPTTDERDPDYVDENYPGYTSFLPCAKPDSENGIPWYEKYANEVEYYRYLMRTGKLNDKW